MMDRRTFLAGTGAVLLAAPLAAEGQQATKVARRIGILSPAEPLTAIDVFQKELRDLGYAEGESMRIDYRSSQGRDDRFPALAADLVALKVDVIVAVTPPAIRAAQEATTTIPIVMLLNGDPVRSGLVKSLARPGGNTTGPATLTVDLEPKRLGVFKEAVPNLKEVAVLVNPVYPGVPESLAHTEASGRTLGVRIRSFKVRGPAEVDMALKAIPRARPDGLLIMASPLTSTYMGRIIDVAAKHRLPTMDPRRQFPEHGGLLSYGIDYAEHVRSGLRYVDKILKGAKPGDLPVEQPTKFELVINLKTAKALGLTIPPSLLGRADEVIQ